jgi:osmotically-inducible protein OsmY
MTIFKLIPLLCLTALLIFSIGCAATRTQESTGEYIDDTTISTKIRAELLAEPNLKSSQISVETFKGAVQLSGFVSSVEQTNTAVSIARNVNGVVEVHNDMLIRGQ